MSLFWIDPARNHSISYQELAYKISLIKTVKKYIKDSDPFLVFEKLIAALVHNIDVTLLDADFSDSELNQINLNAQDIAQEITVEPISFIDVNNLITRIFNANEDWRLEIFTSGTTGRPKSINQSFLNLTRGVKKDNRFVEDVWSFSYNPTHFAGLQVFFQGFLNQNAFVYNFDKTSKEIIDSFYKHGITRLSFTPTFCRQLLPYINKPIETVKSITFGGEKFDSKIAEKLKEHFPNAKVRNIYASTEVGSILSTDGEYFSIPTKLLNFVQISSNNELLIHLDLLGDIKSKMDSIRDNWYSTGDLVEVYSENKFKFLSRKSEMINVGGYKVNPHEVEDVIKSIDGIIEVVVIARKNSVLGNILVAKIISNKDKVEMKQMVNSHLKKNLQEWKIPRLIKFVESIEKTRTSKIKRS